MKRRYDYVPDLPDQRDHSFALAAPAAIVQTYPQKVDLRPQCPPIKDQGQLGSCTANSLTSAVEFELRRAGRKTRSLSRLFVYYNERKLENTVHFDAGAQIRNGVKSLAKQGVCLETDWPYNVAKYKTKPVAGCYTRAVVNAIKEYQRLESKQDMIICLAMGFPFVFGFSVYDSFESDQVAKTGVVPLPTITEKLLGGHAVYAAGYDLDADLLICGNSWGTRWGQKGFFTIPFSYVTNADLAEDFWTIRA